MNMSCVKYWCLFTLVKLCVLLNLRKIKQLELGKRLLGALCLFSGGFWLFTHGFCLFVGGLWLFDDSLWCFVVICLWFVIVCAFLWSFVVVVCFSNYGCRLFPSMHCNSSIPRNFSYRRHENDTRFSLPSSNLLSSPGSKSHSQRLNLKINVLSRPLFPSGTTSPRNFQHMPSSIKLCLFLMNLFNAILLN